MRKERADASLTVLAAEEETLPSRSRSSSSASSRGDTGLKDRASEGPLEPSDPARTFHQTDRPISHSR